MKRMASALGVAFAIGGVAGLLGGQALNAQPPTVTVKEALRADLAGMDGKEVIVQLVEMGPGTGTGKHYHPGHEVAYVLEGSGVLESEGGPTLSMKPGDAAYIPPRQVHEGTSAAGRLKLIVFRIHEKGQPVTVRAE